MTLRFIAVVLVCSLPPIAAWAQTENEMLELAKLGVVEKLYNSSEPQLRAMLSARGLVKDEVDRVLYDAFEELAACFVKAAWDQAFEQGLPVSIVLKGIGGKTRGKEESKILLELDFDALKAKQKPCQANFNEKLGIVNPP